MIVCFGSINLDLIFPLPYLPVAGQTVLGRAMKLEPGGKGANQAAAAARDGARVAFAGAVGRDSLAEQALATMRAAGVDLSRVAVTDTSTGAAGICVDPEGRNQIAVASGANLLAREAQVEDALLGPATTVLLQGECDLGETAALVARAKARGARVVLNLAPPAPLPLATLKALDVLVVNEDEGAWLGKHLGTDGSAAGLHAALGVPVVMTLGGDGLQAATAKGVTALPARKVTVVDTTAAGDCFTGVLAAALDRGQTLAEAIDRANVAAGLCCSKAGSQGSLPFQAETDAALAA
jgi:ribokinase